MIIAQNDISVASEVHLMNSNRLIIEAHIKKGENIQKQIESELFMDKVPLYYLKDLIQEGQREALRSWINESSQPALYYESILRDNHEEEITKSFRELYQQYGQANKQKNTLKQVELATDLHRIICHRNRLTYLTPILEFWNKTYMADHKFQMSMKSRLPELIKKKQQQSKTTPVEEITQELEETFHQAFIEEDQIHIRNFQNIVTEQIRQMEEKDEQSKNNVNVAADLLDELECLYSQQQQSREMLKSKQISKIEQTNKYFTKQAIDLFTINLCLGNQKKHKISIQVYDLEIEEVFDPEFCSYFLHVNNIAKNQMNDPKFAESIIETTFLDSVARRGMFLNQITRDQALKTFKSRIDNIFKFKTELYFQQLNLQFQELLQNVDPQRQFNEVTFVSNVHLMQFILNSYQDKQTHDPIKLWEIMNDLVERHRVSDLFIPLNSLFNQSSEKDFADFAKFLRTNLNEIAMDYTKQHTMEHIVFFTKSSQQQKEFVNALKYEFQ